MALAAGERNKLIERYARGPGLLQAALAKVPREALQWRPGLGRWSAHEIIVHCADSETNSHGRLRFLLAEMEPVIQGYDQDRWAQVLEYHTLPLDAALATVIAVRANTVPVLERMNESDWQRRGRHSESGAYSTEDWLVIYAEHLEKHSRQIDGNLAAWNSR